MSITRTQNELYQARGRAEISLLDDDEKTTGWYALGSSTITMETSTEKVQERSAETRASELIANMESNISRTLTISTKNMAWDNYVRFLAALESVVTQSATPVTGELHTVKQGAIYQIGQTTTNPFGVQKVSAVTVTSEDGLETYVLGDDYELDSALGLINIVKGGAIVDDSVIKVGYTPSSGTYARVETGDTVSKLYAIRFTSDNNTASGADADRDLYFAKVSLAPDGELPLANTETDFVSIGFKGEVLKPANAPAVVGRTRLAA